MHKVCAVAAYLAPQCILVGY